MEERTFRVPPQILRLPVEAGRRNAEGGEIGYLHWACEWGQQEVRPGRPRRDVPTGRGYANTVCIPSLFAYRSLALLRTKGGER